MLLFTPAALCTTPEWLPDLTAQLQEFPCGRPLEVGGSCCYVNGAALQARLLRRDRTCCSFTFSLEQEKNKTSTLVDFLLFHSLKKKKKINKAERAKEVKENKIN